MHGTLNYEDLTHAAAFMINEDSDVDRDLSSIGMEEDEEGFMDIPATLDTATQAEIDNALEQHFATLQVEATGVPFQPKAWLPFLAISPLIQ